MDFLERIVRKGSQLEESMESNNNQGMELIDLVFTLYQYRMKREHLIKPKLLKNIKIKGKNIESQIDIYFEFVQMNNLERTVIKTIDKKTVTVDDVWQFDNILKAVSYTHLDVYKRQDRSGSEDL